MIEKPRKIQEICEELAKSLHIMISEGKISKPEDWLEEVFPGDFRSHESARLFYAQYLEKLYPSNLRELAVLAVGIESIMRIESNDRMQRIRALKKSLQVKLRGVKNRISYELI